MKQDPKIESLERKYRRHEVSFSQIQGKNSKEYVDNYIHEHSMEESNDIVEEMVKKIDRRVLYRSIKRLPEDDQKILVDYMCGVKQKDIANKFGISPSAINQRLDKIMYNYRCFVCADKEFFQTGEFDKLQQETEETFKAYLDEIRKTGQFKIDLQSVRDFIKDVRKAIRHLVETGADKNIKEKLTKQINYSKLDDEWIKKTNAQFAALGIEAHLENLKKFKGNVMQVLKMVDDFVAELQKKAL